MPYCLYVSIDDISLNQFFCPPITAVKITAVFAVSGEEEEVLTLLGILYKKTEKGQKN
jgi:hypothetical protein